jgi:AcrR family transcriptional regulator
VSSRRRLTPAQRRDELLDLGAALFADRAYDEVEMADVAAQAGVSRALLYRYFPAKRDFFAAVFERASAQLLAASPIDPALPLPAQVEAGLDAHFDYFRTHARTILTANRGAMAGDPVVQKTIAAELGTLRNRVLDAAQLDDRARARVAVALDGWLSFVRAASLEWLEHETITQAELKTICLGALAGAVGADLTVAADE